MKCTAVGCKCESTNNAKTLWGKETLIGFCEKHTPEWLKGLSIGELSPETNMMGIKKSWYKKVE